MSRRKLTTISISDIHLGNRLVSADFIIENLNKALPDNESMADVDIIYLAGDVFDQLLHFADDHIDPIQLWIVHLLRLCVKWDILLYVLEGTPSHDRGQSKRFITLNEMLDIGAHIRYIDTLHIEYIERFGIHVLFVPDEYHSDNDVTLNEVRDLLALNQIDQVDYAVMHGMFEHQCPRGIMLPTHNAEAYLALVKKYIFIGHVHQMSQHERILSQGSFDRLCHGEEEDKGFWRVVADYAEDSNDRLTFVVNETAKIFKTINIVGMDKKAATKALDVVKNIPDYSYTRVMVEKGDLNIPLVDSYVKKYPLLRWKVETAKEKLKSGESKIIQEIIFKPTPINPNTIQELVAKRLKEKNLDDATIKGTLRVLESVA